MRQITDKAREFGAGPLFNQILPLLMSPTLEDQERHLLVKVIDRILYKLDDLVRPYVHKVWYFFNVKGIRGFSFTNLHIFVKFKNSKNNFLDDIHLQKRKFCPLAR